MKPVLTEALPWLSHNTHISISVLDHDKETRGKTGPTARLKYVVTISWLGDRHQDMRTDVYAVTWTGPLFRVFEVKELKPNLTNVCFYRGADKSLARPD